MKINNAQECAQKSHFLCQEFLAKWRPSPASIYDLPNTEFKGAGCQPNCHVSVGSLSAISRCKVDNVCQPFGYSSCSSSPRCHTTWKQPWGSFCWFAWCYWKWPTHRYVKSAAFAVLLLNLSISLELLDFPPLFWTFDSHALWHLSTAFIHSIWYQFIIDDCQSLAKEAGESSIRKIVW